ncbi:hypothetical protein [Shewanella psychromarinicola]|uniref:Uncharacterized protein n=1 Tax=Shewanella psychromarinicola TaxID=2487742 RepID=A0A3N4ECK4_9GAMM|nr:hypothetical protein [Shewanella psychromarinicola]AZG36240.1 hypothetical protein EGC80_16045 [Shewanella psychromarinicola]MCL1082150.1 hypothetical protein [Shewanella psychromarinicola]RPA27334.1 hypothetical protein EGC77_17315 [Shewanella psychromarinicola]
MKLVMNYTKNYLKSLVTIIFGIAIMLSGNSFGADKQIALTVNECAVSASVNGGSGCDADQCASEAGCICTKKGDFITWKLDNEVDSDFKLKFSGDSPLKDNCGKNFKKSERKCKVKESLTIGQSFDYQVVMQGCDNGSDPRIIIQ